jgi:hypothetical protein
MSSNFDDLESWPLGEIVFQDRAASMLESASWNFSPEASPDPAHALQGLGSFRQDSDPNSDLFAKSLLSSKADRAAASKSLEELMLRENHSLAVVSSSNSQASALSSSYPRKRGPSSEGTISHSKRSALVLRSPRSDDFASPRSNDFASSSKSLRSFASSSSSTEGSYEILSSVSPPLPRNLSLLSDEQRSTLQSIVASRRQFLSRSRKSNLEKMNGENLNSEEEMLSHVIRTYIFKIPRDHSRLQLDQSTQALRHFIEMQLCIPFENFLITDAKLPGIILPLHFLLSKISTNDLMHNLPFFIVA